MARITSAAATASPVAGGMKARLAVAQKDSPDIKPPPSMSRFFPNRPIARLILDWTRPHGTLKLPHKLRTDDLLCRRQMIPPA